MDTTASLGIAVGRGGAPLQARLKYGRVVKNLTLDRLFEIVRGLDPNSPFVVVERMGATEGDYYAQALHRPDGTWIVEYRDGCRNRHYQADAPGPGVVYEVLAAWSLGLSDWRLWLRWTPLFL